MATEEMVTNELGLRMRRVERGTFEMGRRSAERGNRDERPRHEVRIETPFYIAETPITNAQFEMFDEAHLARRGRRGLSTDDDEAAVFVSWDDATAYCEWLETKTGDPYRLPTEAEWEYACRAGTTTPYHTGEELPEAYRREQCDDWHPAPTDLTVGTTPPNAWGIRDCHGLVEEWCHDWYGRYPDTPRVDPVGPADGYAKVTRGGSHNTGLEYLRAANRLAALPGTRNWLIGFRPVLGPLPDAEPDRNTVVPKHARDGVPSGDGTVDDWDRPSPSGEPFFEGPIRFVDEPANPESVPFYGHNHCPAVTWCESGDLLAIWFSCEAEHDREMVILGSRFSRKTERWSDPFLFFELADRNLTGSALLRASNGTIYHFNGVGAGSHWANLALVVRTSTDDGRTWSDPRFVNSDYGYRNQAIAGPIETSDGRLVQPCDAVSSGNGGTAIHVSADGGETWIDPGRDQPAPIVENGATGGSIAGIHASVVELEDGRLLAFGRGDVVDGRLPASVSSDGGRSWTYEPTPFPPLDTGQRLALFRLEEGPLLLASFTDPANELEDPDGMRVRTAGGEVRCGYGLFVALTFDEGETWPVRRLVTPGDDREADGGAWTGTFRADDTHAEPRGYLAATQTPDGIVHLLSSSLHYRFDIDWLLEHSDR
ncbi:SUMF1/EgtB/PvdO family nonheme iron enzyme [Halomontanus rarus]|uniref:SUMF1/EgtB/PvdO family nonheme iron enzyme n=1 Tax=Halomontanus rarus TaxID=3034020 RepID=UPI00293B8E7F|nr:SUMF1/EgtB/PvdO family nonheme iron enzyme [Halovivax sp. KZCA124]